jgi:NAD(P)H-dependent FMN reductase
MQNLIRVGLVYGSTRPGRFCDVVAKWAAEQIARQAGFLLIAVDPATVPDNGSLEPLRQRIAECEAFVVVTPEYNHGYPAPLKSLIDAIGPEWQAKPAGFVSYGGISGGLRAVEQLRQVFAELHAVTMRDSVSFASAWEQFDSDGKLRNAERAERSMATMLARLHWWASALKAARTARPYDLAA